MLRIKIYQGSKSMENYLNQQSHKGYELELLTTFGLFEPLRIDTYNFKKGTNNNRIYRVDSRMVNADDFAEYKQIFHDDGWVYFNKNYVNDNFNVDNIFYSDNPSKQVIFSDDTSKKKQNRDNASMGLYKGTVLFVIFIFFSLLLPSVNSGSSNTVWGFILHNIYLIIAIIIMLVSLIKYIMHRQR